MDENVVLRNLLKELSRFIGEGLGGSLQKIGWEVSKFQGFLNKAETDTVYEAFVATKRAKDGQHAEQTSPAAEHGTENGAGPSNKRKRTMDSSTPSGTDETPDNSLGTFNVPSSNGNESMNFNSLLNGFSIPPASPNTSLYQSVSNGISSSGRQPSSQESTQYGQPQGSALFQTSFTPPLNLYGSGPPRSVATPILPMRNIQSYSGSMQSSEPQDVLFGGMVTVHSGSGAQEEKRNEAGKLYCVPNYLYTINHFMDSGRLIR